MVLVGMPAVGKTTVGKRLARATGRAFVDTDDLIRESAGAAVPDLLASLGPEGFRELEERCVAGLDCCHHVIATGGSVVYGERSMMTLAGLGVIVHLDLPLRILERRLANAGGRGVVMRPGQSLASLFAERDPLYRRWADVTVPVAGFDHEETVGRIRGALATM